MTHDSLLQALLNRCHCEFKLEDFQLSPYNIKLNNPWKSASVSMPYRQGFIVRLFTRQGLIGNGDCAALPELGTETLFQAQQQLEGVLKQNQGRLISESWLETFKHHPAARFALETAILSLVSQHKKQNLARLLNPGFQKTININTMCGPLHLSSRKSVAEAESKGFRCLKFKLGISSVETEAAHLRHILQWTRPDTRIRLDCNKSWSFKQSQWFIHFINRELAGWTGRIDSIEEPLADYNHQQYQVLQAQSPVSLALDESLIHIANLDDLPVNRLVLKPTLTGGIIKTWQTAQAAQARGLEVVVTSALETGYGLWPITALAAALANQQFHGLATASWLTDTLIKAPEISHGTITL